MITEGRLQAIRGLVEDQNRERLAIDALLAACVGDSTQQAISRLRDVRESLPLPRSTKTAKDRMDNELFNDICDRAKEMLDTALRDLTRLEQVGGKDG